MTDQILHAAMLVVPQGGPSSRSAWDPCRSSPWRGTETPFPSNMYIQLMIAIVLGVGRCKTKRPTICDQTNRLKCTSITGRQGDIKKPYASYHILTALHYLWETTQAPTCIPNANRACRTFSSRFFFVNSSSRVATTVGSSATYATHRWWAVGVPSPSLSNNRARIASANAYRKWWSIVSGT